VLVDGVARFGRNASLAENKLSEGFLGEREMAGIDPQIEWYLARDGQQHGPLTDAEIRKFVELGHMRATDLVWRSGFSDWRPAAAVFPAAGRSQVPTTRDPSSRSRHPQQSETAYARQPSARGTASSGQRNHRGDAKRPKRRIGRTLFFLVVILALGAGGWIAWQHRDELLDQAFIKELLSWSASSSPSSSEGFRVSPFAAAGDTADRIDESLQQTALWSLLKREFPEWYQDRVKDIERARTEKRDDAAIGKSLAEAVVALRRKNGTPAYAASPDALKRIATSFIDTLDQLHNLGDEVCYGFVSQGEPFAASQASLGPQHLEPLHRQIVAVFLAIAEGRRSGRSVERGRKEDYDALTIALTGRGWSDEDLHTFSDQRLLAKAAPNQVCRLVRDWIAAQMELRDGDAQTRLLTDSLRPLISG